MCTNDPLCDGSWGKLLDQPSQNQIPEGVQDQFNFGSGAYNADPKAFNMEENIDVGQTIQNSVKGGGKGIMKQAYNKAQQSGKPVPFNFVTRFGGDYSKLAKTKAWPFGRVTGIVSGNISVKKDGSYTATGSISIKSDDYSWNEDGNWAQNIAIFLGGNNWNGPSIGDAVINNPGVGPSHINWASGKGGSSKIDTTGLVRWRTPSSNYNNGQMPINYTRQYNFTAHGEK